MQSWTGIVLALPRARGDEMVSRLPAYLHPVAGRPLVWHAVSSLAALDPAPSRIVVAAPAELSEAAFPDVAAELEIVPAQGGDAGALSGVVERLAGPVLVLDGVAWVDAGPLRRLMTHAPGTWLGQEGGGAAAWLHAGQLTELLRLPEPLSTPNGVLSSLARRDEPHVLVRSRMDLAEVARHVRDRLVRRLMEGGASFLLPESVLVDVDVRIGRDTVVYPGVALEGQTSVGEETVIGPGCRIIDSWIGSGVELKGWNYISHTSVRNRAILEPYVRRGFD